MHKHLVRLSLWLRALLEFLGIVHAVSYGDVIIPQPLPYDFDMVRWHAL